MGSANGDPLPSYFQSYKSLTQSRWNFLSQWANLSSPRGQCVEEQHHEKLWHLVSSRLPFLVEQYRMDTSALTGCCPKRGISSRSSLLFSNHSSGLGQQVPGPKCWPAPNRDWTRRNPWTEFLACAYC